MFLYLSKLAPPFVYPFGLGLVLLAIGNVLPKRMRLGRILCLSALVLFFAFSIDTVCGALLHSLEDRYPELNIAAIPRGDAIVVLGGMLRSPGRRHKDTELTDSADRLLEGLRLYRAGKAPLILITGGNVPFLGGRDQMPEAQAAGELLQMWGVPAEAILVEYASMNTRENGVNSYRLLSPKGLHRILLVTSATHMPRAAAVFRKVGFEVTAVPADFQTGWGEPDVVFRWIPDAGNLSRSQGALKEWLGFVVYWTRGWV